MAKNKVTSPILSKHETFYPRYSWLKKGFDKAREDSAVFLRKDAHVTLGVGKNMVRSIRYWCHAFKVLEEIQCDSSRQKPSHPTIFGESLLGLDGLDPYIEDLGSLWLLHWQLLKRPCFATAWHFVFFIHPSLELTSNELMAGLASYLKRDFPNASRAESSLKKDALCILRMYGEVATGKAVSEDTLHCPFAELGLIRPGTKSRTYEFRMGAKPGLTSHLIVSACLDFMSELEAGARTISVTRLLRGPGSPGLAFKLTEGALYAALEDVVGQRSELDLEDAGGIIQLSVRRPPDVLSSDLITAHYEAAGQLGVGV